MVSTHCRPNTSVIMAKAPERSDASTQMELVRMDASVQAVGCNECPDPSPGVKVSTCTRCAQVDDLLRQVAELQDTVRRLSNINISRTEMEIGSFRTALL